MMIKDYVLMMHCDGNEHKKSIGIMFHQTFFLLLHKLVFHTLFNRIIASALSPLNVITFLCIKYRFGKFSCHWRFNS